MFIVYPENCRNPTLFLEESNAVSFNENDSGTIHKLRHIRPDEQGNIVAYASVSRGGCDIALFLDFSRASLYASRHAAIVESLVLDLEYKWNTTL